MTMLRAVAGLLAAALFVVLAAPATALARRLGWRSGPAASVILHRWLCAILRVRVRRYGTPGSGRRLIVANHVSWLDILVLGSLEPMAFLAKSEVGNSVWTRWLVDLQGVVYVERQRKRCIPGVNAEMARRMASDDPVALFGEGTTSDGTRFLPMKTSHFEAARQASACVQPVYLDYRAIGGVSATRNDKATVAWYGDTLFLPSLFEVLRCGGVACEVHYGEPIAAQSESNRKALARETVKRLRAVRNQARRGPAGSPP